MEEAIEPFQVQQHEEELSLGARGVVNECIY